MLHELRSTPSDCFRPRGVDERKPNPMLLAKTAADDGGTGPGDQDYSYAGTWLPQIRWKRPGDIAKTSSRGLRPCSTGSQAKPYSVSDCFGPSTKVHAFRIIGTRFFPQTEENISSQIGRVQPLSSRKHFI